MHLTDAQQIVNDVVDARKSHYFSLHMNDNLKSIGSEQTINDFSKVPETHLLNSILKQRPPSSSGQTFDSLNVAGGHQTSYLVRMLDSPSPETGHIMADVIQQTSSERDVDSSQSNTYYDMTNVRETLNVPDDIMEGPGDVMLTVTDDNSLEHSLVDGNMERPGDVMLTVTDDNSLEHSLVDGNQQIRGEPVALMPNALETRVTVDLGSGVYNNDNGVNEYDKDKADEINLMSDIINEIMSAESQEELISDDINTLTSNNLAASNDTGAGPKIQQDSGNTIDFSQSVHQIIPFDRKDQWPGILKLLLVQPGGLLRGFHYLLSNFQTRNLPGNDEEVNSLQPLIDNSLWFDRERTDQPPQLSDRAKTQTLFKHLHLFPTNNHEPSNNDNEVIDTFSNEATGITEVYTEPLYPAVTYNGQLNADVKEMFSWLQGNGQSKFSTLPTEILQFLASNSDAAEINKLIESLQEELERIQSWLATLPAKEREYFLDKTNSLPRLYRDHLQGRFIQMLDKEFGNAVVTKEEQQKSQDSGESVFSNEVNNDKNDTDDFENEIKLRLGVFKYDSDVFDGNQWISAFSEMSSENLENQRAPLKPKQRNERSTEDNQRPVDQPLRRRERSKDWPQSDVSSMNHKIRNKKLFLTQQFQMMKHEKSQETRQMADVQNNQILPWGISAQSEGQDLFDAEGINTPTQSRGQGEVKTASSGNNTTLLINKDVFQNKIETNNESEITTSSTRQTISKLDSLILNVNNVSETFRLNQSLVEFINLTDGDFKKSESISKRNFVEYPTTDGKPNKRNSGNSSDQDLNVTVGNFTSANLSTEDVRKVNEKIAHTHLNTSVETSSESSGFKLNNMSLLRDDLNETRGANETLKFPGNETTKVVHETRQERRKRHVTSIQVDNIKERGIGPVPSWVLNVTPEPATTKTSILWRPPTTSVRTTVRGQPTFPSVHQEQQPTVTTLQQDIREHSAGITKHGSWKSQTSTFTPNVMKQKYVITQDTNGPVFRSNNEQTVQHTSLPLKFVKMHMMEETKTSPPRTQTFQKETYIDRYLREKQIKDNSIQKRGFLNSAVNSAQYQNQKTNRRFGINSIEPTKSYNDVRTVKLEGLNSNRNEADGGAKSVMSYADRFLRSKNQIAPTVHQIEPTVQSFVADQAKNSQSQISSQKSPPNNEVYDSPITDQTSNSRGQMSSNKVPSQNEMSNSLVSDQTGNSRGQMSSYKVPSQKEMSNSLVSDQTSSSRGQMSSYKVPSQNEMSNSPVSEQTSSSRGQMSSYKVPSQNEMSNSPISDQTSNSRGQMSSYKVPSQNEMSNSPVSDQTSNSRGQMSSYKVPSQNEMSNSPVSDQTSNSRGQMSSYKVPSQNEMSNSPVSEQTSSSRGQMSSYKVPSQNEMSNSPISDQTSNSRGQMSSYKVPSQNEMSNSPVSDQTSNSRGQMSSNKVPSQNEMYRTDQRYSQPPLHKATIDVSTRQSKESINADPGVMPMEPVVVHYQPVITYYTPPIHYSQIPDYLDFAANFDTSGYLDQWASSKNDPIRDQGSIRTKDPDEEQRVSAENDPDTDQSALSTKDDQDSDQKPISFVKDYSPDEDRASKIQETEEEELTTDDDVTDQSDIAWSNTDQKLTLYNLGDDQSTLSGDEQRKTPSNDPTVYDDVDRRINQKGFGNRYQTINSGYQNTDSGYQNINSGYQNINSGSRNYAKNLNFGRQNKNNRNYFSQLNTDTNVQYQNQFLDETRHYFTQQNDRATNSIQRPGPQKIGRYNQQIPSIKTSSEGHDKDEEAILQFIYSKKKMNTEHPGMSNDQDYSSPNYYLTKGSSSNKGKQTGEDKMFIQMISCDLTGPDIYYRHRYCDLTGPDIYYRHRYCDLTGPDISYRHRYCDLTGPDIYYRHSTTKYNLMFVDKKCYTCNDTNS
ncbi:hypothetical protein Btru_076403 [Bulinus truncatus]|nr:hypothetical protein Btru_076403 [Bulinus truncatus]